MFVMTLEHPNEEKLDCLYDDEMLFAASNDLEQTDVWEKYGYAYENGRKKFYKNLSQNRMKRNVFHKKTIIFVKYTNL